MTSLPFTFRASADHLWPCENITVPEAAAISGAYELGRDHWFYCDTARVRWIDGSSFSRRPRLIAAEDALRHEAYRPVETVYCGEDEARA